MNLTAADRLAPVHRLDTMRRQVLDELLQAGQQTLAQSDLNASQEVHTCADQADAEMEDDIRLAGIEVDRHRLQDIEQARQRLADGRYGVCATCGDDIPRERLLAQPTAIRCAACQATFESRTR